MLSIDRETRWVVSPDLPGAVGLAIDDIRRDWRRVFATHPYEVAVDATPSTAEVVLAIGTRAVRELAGPTLPLEAEQHVLEVRDRTEGQGKVLCAYGEGTRGEIYAAYALSRHVLGVDPFWYWTGREVELREELPIATNLAVRAGTPTFEWRGWFCNDEDLLTAWAPSLQASHGISLNVWDRIFETLLRLGGNFVVPGTFVFPSEPQIARAGERGLAIGQHHIEVLGLNTYRWPNEIPYSFATHPEILRDAWRESVASYGNAEVIWSVGYRGRHDRPFWYDDESAGTDDASRGALISAAIAAQVEIVREGRPTDTILLNLWMEGVDLWRAGHLVIPEGVSVVWPDDGHGQILDHGEIAPGHGVYYHTAMHDRIASQMSEMVDVGLITSELKRAADAGATSHLLVNVSDVRPVIMTTQAAMDLAWDPQRDTSRFYEDWAAQHVDAEHAGVLAGLWRRYFQAPWHYSGGYPDRLEDNAYQTFARALLMDAANEGFTEPFVFTTFLAHIPRAYRLLGDLTVLDFARTVELGTSTAQPVLDELHEDATRLVGSLGADAARFVEGHLLTQVALHRASNEMLHHVASTVVEAAPGGDRAAALTLLSDAGEAAVEILRVLRRGERHPWQDFYRGDVFLAVDKTIEMIRALEVRWSPGSETPGAQLKDPNLPVLQYQTIKAYQRGQLAGPSALVEELQT